MSLLLWAMKSSLVLLIGLAVSRNKRLGAANRHTLLVAALFCTPLLLVSESVSISPIVALEPPVMIVEYASNLQSSLSSTDAADHRQIHTSSASPIDGWSLFWACYSLVVVVLLVRLLVRVRQASQRVQCMPIIATEPIEVRLAETDQSPFAWGLLRGCVVVPRTWFDWPESKRRSVMLHEHAHLQRHDGLVSTLIYIVCVVFWLHPLVWSARRRSQLLAEHACDDAVVNRGVQKTTYAQHLLEISKTQATQLAPSMAHLSQLGSRINVLLDESTRREPMTFRNTVTLMCTTLAVMALVFSIGLAGEARAEFDGVRQELVTRLATAQVHIDDEALADARRVINQAREIENLNANEHAQIANMSGYAFFRAGNYQEAIAEYEKVVHEKSIPPGLRTTTLYTLAQLSFVQGQYENAISFMRRWVDEADNPGPIPKIFIAQTYYQLEDFESALTTLNDALALAEERGSAVNPNWLKLRNYLVDLQNGEASHPPPSHLGVNGDYFPIAKVAPVYPPAAKQHRIEGYVLVEFSVGENGRPQNARVVNAQPPEIFDRAALAAVEKFKYKPRLVNGEPVVVDGVRNKISFTLDDS